MSDQNVIFGDRVFTLTNRSPELYANIPAVLKKGASVGEPLNPEVIIWAERVFGGAQVYDNYWQTETGSHVIANRPGKRVVCGAMGKAKEIEFVRELSKTKSGKIQREILRRKGEYDEQFVFLIE